MHSKGKTESADEVPSLLLRVQEMESKYLPLRFSVAVTNLDVQLETVRGVTYPHHIFGSGGVLQNGDGELLLPGLRGEVRVKEGQRYTVEQLEF